MSHRDAAVRKILLKVLGGVAAFVLLGPGGPAALTDARASQHGASAPQGETVEDRIRPVGKVRIKGQVSEEPAAAAAGAAERSGVEVYNLACAACHSTGAAGAPKLGDKAAWAPRLEQGFETLVKHAIGGFNAMPPRGGNPTLSDAEVTRGVAHLVEQVGMKVTLPAPAAAPGAAAAPASPPPPAGPASPAAGAAPGGTGGADLARGETIYKQACFACHQMGVVGAPKLGDRAAWGPRIAQGLEVLGQNALRGIRGMPAKGGRVDLADEVVLDAVAYMVQQSS